MNISVKRLFLIALFAVTAIYYIPVINLPLAPYDEAVILVGADKVLNGQVPHRDFSSEYPAGQLYTLAAFFKTFGTSVLTERVYDLLVKSLLSLSVFVVIRAVSSHAAAMAGWLMSLIWLQHSSFPAYPMYPSLLLILIGVYLLLLHMKKEGNHYVVLAALFIACAIMFRHDMGGYAAIAVSLLLALRAIVGGHSWVPLGSFIGTSVLAGVAVVLFFYMNSATGHMLDDLLFIPMAFRKYQALPYPSLSRWNLSFYVFPLVIFGGTLAGIYFAVRRKNVEAAYIVLLISFIGIISFNQSRSRSDVIHLLPVALTGILLAPVLLEMFLGELSKGWQKKAAIGLFVVVFAITFSKPVKVINRLLTITNGYSIKSMNPDLERAEYVKISPELKNLTAYIKDNSTKDETIYVGVKNHDQFVFNDVIIYFLAERSCATRYHVLNPGVHTTSKVQKEVVNELKENPAKLVVLVPRSRNEPNLSSIDSQVDILDRYISSAYEQKEMFGFYEVRMKKL